jgi:hypothetical protein
MIQWLVGSEVVVLGIAVDDALGLDREPGFAVFAVVVLASCVFAAADL